MKTLKLYMVICTQLILMLVTIPTPTFASLVTIDGQQQNYNLQSSGEISLNMNSMDSYAYCVDRAHYLYQRSYLYNEIAISTSGLAKAAWVIDNFAYSEIGSITYNGTYYSGVDLGTSVQFAVQYLSDQLTYNQTYYKSGYLWSLVNYFITQSNYQNIKTLMDTASKFMVIDLYYINSCGFKVESQDLLTKRATPVPSTLLLISSGIIVLLGMRKRINN